MGSGVVTRVVMTMLTSQVYVWVFVMTVTRPLTSHQWDNFILSNTDSSSPPLRECYWTINPFSPCRNCVAWMVQNPLSLITGNTTETEKVNILDGVHCHSWLDIMMRCRWEGDRAEIVRSLYEWKLPWSDYRARERERERERERDLRVAGDTDTLRPHIVPAVVRQLTVRLSDNRQQHGQEENQHCSHLRREKQTSYFYQEKIWLDEEGLRIKCSLWLWNRSYNI